MFTSTKHFLQAWEFEAGATQNMLDVLTDESLAQEVTSQDRTFDRIACSIGEVKEVRKENGM
jgi:uncharacterized damage-inducible protein DinB